MDKNLNNNQQENLHGITEVNQKSDSGSAGESDAKVKKKKILKRVILTIAGVLIGLPLVAIVIAGCIFGFDTVAYVLKQDNILAFVNSMRYSSEDIETKLTENQDKMEKVVADNPLIEIRGGLTPEETTALAEGKISSEQAVEIVKGDLTLDEAINAQAAAQQQAAGQTAAPQTDAAQAQQGGTPSAPPASGSAPAATPAAPGQSNPSPAPSQPAKTEPPKQESGESVDKVSTLVSELYVVQADFLSRLEAVGDQAYADYKATHYDRSKVTAIVDSYTATVGAMEAECDKKVNSIVKELKAAIQEANGDMSLVKEVTNYYYSEKSLKKSYYLDKMYAEDYK